MRLLLKPCFSEMRAAMGNTELPAILPCLQRVAAREYRCLWTLAGEVKGWDKDDRDFRLATFSEIVGPT